MDRSLEDVLPEGEAPVRFEASLNSDSESITSGVFVFNDIGVARRDG
jgi:hypothetical protein